MEIRVPEATDDELGAVLGYYDGDGRTVLCRADGSGRVELDYVSYEVCPLTGRVAWDRWVPDEESTLEHDDDETTHDLNLFDPAGGESTRITPEVRGVDFAWAADTGDLWVGIDRENEEDVRRLHWLRHGAPELERVTEGGRPAPSPDGRFVAHHREGGLHVLDVADGSVRRVGDGEGHASGWSPDSTRLAVLNVSLIDIALRRADPELDDIRVAWQLFSYTPADDTLTKVAPDRSFTYWPTWTPDGRHLIFETNDRGGSGEPCWLAMAPPDGGPSTPISDGPSDERPRHHPRRPLLVYQIRHPEDRARCDVYVRSMESGELRHLGPGSEARWLR